MPQAHISAHMAAHKITVNLFFIFYNRNHSINAEKLASVGILQSLLGERDTEPTFTPSGILERLNCCEKNLRTKVSSHFFTVSASYTPSYALSAKRYIFEAEKPYLTV